MVGGADAKELGEVFVSRPRNFQMALTSTLSLWSRSPLERSRPVGMESASCWQKVHTTDTKLLLGWVDYKGLWERKRGLHPWCWEVQVPKPLLGRVWTCLHMHQTSQPPHPLPAQAEGSQQIRGRWELRGDWKWSGPTLSFTEAPEKVRAGFPITEQMWT